jgi:hypothetical protein
MGVNSFHLAANEGFVYMMHVTWCELACKIDFGECKRSKILQACLDEVRLRVILRSLQTLL